MAALPALDDFLKSRGIRGVAATRSATAPVRGWSRDATPNSAEGREFDEAVLDYIKMHRPADVILVAHWPYYSRPNSRVPGESFGPALLATAHEIRALGCRLRIMLDTPTHSFDIPRALSRPFYAPDYIDSLRAKLKYVDENDYLDRKFIDGMKAEGVRFLDPKPLFVDPSGTFYRIKDGNVVLYRDSDHLSQQGAKTMLEPFFNDQLDISSARN